MDLFFNDPRLIKNNNNNTSTKGLNNSNLKIRSVIKTIQIKSNNNSNSSSSGQLQRIQQQQQQQQQQQLHNHHQTPSSSSSSSSSAKTSTTKSIVTKTIRKSTTTNNSNNNEPSSSSSSTLKRKTNDNPSLSSKFKKAKWSGSSNSSSTATTATNTTTTAKSTSTTTSSSSTKPNQQRKTTAKLRIDQNPVNLSSQAPSSSDSSSSDSDSEGGQTTIRPSKRLFVPKSPTIPRSVDPSISKFSSSIKTDGEKREGSEELEPLIRDHLSERGSITDSSELVLSNRKRYKRWFRRTAIEGVEPEDDPWKFKDDEDPSVEVVYPSGNSEKFLLLVPKDDEDEYRPIEDVMNVITTTLAYYLTPEQSISYFSEPHPIYSLPIPNRPNPNDFSFLNNYKKSKKRKREGSDLKSNSSITTTNGESSQNDLEFSDLIDGREIEEEEDEVLRGLDQSQIELSKRPLIKSLSRFFRRQNGSEFLRFVNLYNLIIRRLSALGKIGSNVSRMRGLKKNIWETIIGQSYDRRVGPKLELIKNYETWSSNVYGELKPKFVSRIIELVDLKPNMVFVDLGSGVGNIVLQVALEVGCTSVGFEIMEGCSKLGKDQLEEVLGRSLKLWNVSLGLPILIQADFTTDPRVGPWLKQADVILVNNQVFTPDLNESIKLLFLDLKQSTKIISLKPFKTNRTTSNHKNKRGMIKNEIIKKEEEEEDCNDDDNESSIIRKFRKVGRGGGSEEMMIKSRNFNSVESIIRSLGEYDYNEDCVSWTDSFGKFYLAEVDRNLLVKFKERNGIL